MATNSEQPIKTASTTRVPTRAGGDDALVESPASPNVTTKPLAADIAARLRRIEGQARGIVKMLEEGRDCEDMLTQSMAIRSAVDQVGARLMEYHLDRCLLEGFDCDEERMEQLRSALKLWTRFGQPAPAMAIRHAAED